MGRERLLWDEARVAGHCVGPDPAIILSRSTGVYGRAVGGDVWLHSLWVNDTLLIVIMAIALDEAPIFSRVRRATRKYTNRHQP